MRCGASDRQVVAQTPVSLGKDGIKRWDTRGRQTRCDVGGRIQRLRRRRSKEENNGWSGGGQEVG